MNHNSEQSDNERKTNMQRLLLVAASTLALTACGTMHDMRGHHASYAKLGKIAKEHDAQQALLLTREGKLMVVNVATGEIIKPGDERKMPAEGGDGQKQGDMAAKKISDEEFAEIKRKFDSNINVSVTRGSVCIVFAQQPPGQQWAICSPPYPQWW